jgi:hypothetical protein
VSVEEQLHGRSTSQSDSFDAPETMSPWMTAVERMDPIQSSGSGGGDGGTTSATGSPNRVI